MLISRVSAKSRSWLQKQRDANTHHLIRFKVFYTVRFEEWLTDEVTGGHIVVAFDQCGTRPGDELCPPWQSDGSIL